MVATGLPRPAALTSTRDRILAAAADRLRSAPLVELTLASVARHAGLSRQTVYQHFRDREDLLVSVFVAYAEAHLAPTRSRALRGRLTVATLERIFWADVDAARSFFEDVADRDSSVRVGIAEFILESERMREYELSIWAPVLEAFQSAGVLSADLAVQDVARWLSYQQTWLVAHPGRLADDRRLIRSFLLAPLVVER